MKVGDLLTDRNGNVLGVVEEIYLGRFQVRVRGVGVVNFEDIKDQTRLINGNDIGGIEEAYIEMYKVT